MDDDSLFGDEYDDSDENLGSEDDLDIEPTIRIAFLFNLKPGMFHEFMSFFMDELVGVLDGNDIFFEQDWHTVYGNGPRYIFTFVAEDREKVENFLACDDWTPLLDQFESFTETFRQLTTHCDENPSVFIAK